MRLRPYQEEAVAAVTAGLCNGGLGQLHAACGSGKTLMGQQAATRLLPSDATAAVLVPSLALVAQTIATWRALHPQGQQLRILAVCSDDTVADAPLHLSELSAQVTTDPGVIARWLQTPASGLRLIVSTYLSAERLHEALGTTGGRLDLLILDEAHHLTGRIELPSRRMVDRAFVPSARRLYMTATPRIQNGERSDTSVSMDDAGLFGPVLFNYPFSRGIAEGYLEDYRLFIVGVRAAEVRALVNDPRHEYVEGPGAPGLPALVAQAALVRAAEKYGTRRALAFHHRIEQAAEFARTLPRLTRRLSPDLAVPVSAHVDGSMDHDVRDAILDDLRRPPADGWTVISNVRCLGEGVDVPAIDAVLFAHPKSSPVDIVQAVGRALRPHPDSPGPSTVIVPIVVPDEDGEVGDLNPGDYATLWHVVRALRSHDEPLGLELDRSRTNLRIDAPRLPSKITVELPPGAAQGFLDQVKLMLVKQTTSSWWDGYTAALRYREGYGHLNVPLRYRNPGDEFQLGQWLVKQRQFHRKGWLPADRITALEKAGMVWDPSEARWAASYEKAVAWHAEHGHIDVPMTLAGGVRDRLGQWIVRQRQYRRDGTLAADRIERLNALGMIWDHRDSAWQKNLDALAAYRQQHGDTLVPQRYVHEEGIRLGAFVSQMRAKYASGKLPAQRVRDLEEAGMVWHVGPGAQQRRRLLAAAADWSREHGSLDMSYSTRHQGVAVGMWISRMRGAHAAGELPEDLAEELTRLGMRW